MTLDLQNKDKVSIGNYNSKYRILLVGEGNFSFAASLANAFGSAHNIVATSFHKRKKLLVKYGKAARNLNILEDLGCSIAYGVDAHTMSERPLLRGKVFDRIVFNFPHAGFTHDDAQIIKVQMKGFFESSMKMVSDKGQVHVTRKTAWPYFKWDIVKLAQKSGLRLVNKVPFKKSDYPGSYNKNVGKSAVTFMFCPKEQVVKKAPVLVRDSENLVDFLSLKVSLLVKRQEVEEGEKETETRNPDELTKTLEDVEQKVDQVQESVQRLEEKLSNSDELKEKFEQKVDQIQESVEMLEKVLSNSDELTEKLEDVEYNVIHIKNSVRRLEEKLSNSDIRSRHQHHVFGESATLLDL